VSDIVLSNSVAMMSNNTSTNNNTDHKMSDNTQQNTKSKNQQSSAKNQQNTTNKLLNAKLYLYVLCKHLCMFQLNLSRIVDIMQHTLHVFEITWIYS